MTNPTLPSRERAREIDEQVKIVVDGTKELFPGADRQAIQCCAELMAKGQKLLLAEMERLDARLAAYATGALVPAGEVADMRERCAGVCDVKAALAKGTADAYRGDPYGHRTVEEYSIRARSLNEAAALIRALPLSAPEPAPTETEPTP